MKKEMKFKEILINTIYFTAVFVFATLIATQSLARKVNTFQTINSPVFFYVNKEKVVVPTVVAGTVKEIMVTPGQHVSEGDLVVRIDNKMFERKIILLEQNAQNNLSAKTELDILRERRDSYNIYAPKDGVVYQMHTSEGSYLQSGEGAFTLFADDNAHLISYVTPVQYGEIQKNGEVSIYSKRLQQAFKVRLNGIGRVTKDPIAMQSNVNNAAQARKYELIFHFENSEDGAVFIEQESLQLMNAIENEAIKRPMEKVADLWNALIIGGKLN